MLQKRDLQFIRLAVRRRWLTAEEGEDCLFLKRKFGEKYSIEEVIRRRGYLDEEAIAELANDTQQLLNPRGRRPTVAPGRTPSTARMGGSAAQAEPTNAGAVPESSLFGEALGGVTRMVRMDTILPELFKSRRAGPPPLPSAPEPTQAPRVPPPGMATAIGSVPNTARSERPEVEAPPDFGGPDPTYFEGLGGAGISSDLEESPDDNRDRTIIDPNILKQLADYRRAQAEPKEVEIEIEVDTLGEPGFSAEPEPERTKGAVPSPAPRIGVKGPKGVRDEHTVVGVISDLLGSSTPELPPRGLAARPPTITPDIEEEQTPAAYEADRSAPKRERTRPVIDTRPPPAAPSTLHAPPAKPAKSSGPRADALSWDAREARPAPGDSRVRPPPLVPRAPSVVQERVPEVEPVEELVRPTSFDGMDSGAFSDELEGPELGPYVIKRTIARGGMGIVYLAEPKSGGPPVALKVLKGSLAHRPEFLARFEREAKAAAAVRSEHVVRVLDAGTIDGRHYLAMEYVDGWTLSERLDSGDRPDLLESLRIARDIARALEAAEAHELVHRDVKPENVMISKNGTVLLMDFGLAKELRAGRTLTDAKDLIVGTPNYMAPEQASGKDVDRRTDLYSLGATMFHMLVGRPVFSGRSSVSIVAKQVRLPAPDIRGLDATIPTPVAAVVKKLLEKKPEDRFQSASELGLALAGLIADLGRPEQAAIRARAEGSRSVLPIALAISVLLVGLALAIPAGLEASRLVPWERPVALLRSALFGAGTVVAAFGLFVFVSLIRRGEVPLPGQTAWLVTAVDVCGAFGAACLVASVMLAAPAVLNLAVSAFAAVVLGSWIYGTLLRRRIASLRPDRGVGHMLAVLGDPKLQRWRLVHAPLLTTLALLATTRFALLAYFQATGL